LEKFGVVLHKQIIWNSE